MLSTVPKNKKYRKKLLDFFGRMGIIISVPVIEDLCNGSTPDSDSVCGGSNPSSSAIRITQNSSEFWGFFLLFATFEVQNVRNFKGGFLVSLTVSLISSRIL